MASSRRSLVSILPSEALRIIYSQPPSLVVSPAMSRFLSSVVAYSNMTSNIDSPVWLRVAPVSVMMSRVAVGAEVERRRGVVRGGYYVARYAQLLPSVHYEG